MSNGPVVRTVQLLVASARSWIDDRVIRLGAAVAYYSLFTLIPVLFLAVSLASIFFGQDRVTPRWVGREGPFRGGSLACLQSLALVPCSPSLCWQRR